MSWLGVEGAVFFCLLCRESPCAVCRLRLPNLDPGKVTYSAKYNTNMGTLHTYVCILYQVEAHTVHLK